PAVEVRDDYLFGMTLAQVDDLNRRLQMLRAQGDLLMASSYGVLADGTLAVTGASVFDGAEAVCGIIQEITTQELGDGRRARRRVRAAAAAYGVAATPASPRPVSVLH